MARNADARPDLLKPHQPQPVAPLEPGELGVFGVVDRNVRHRAPALVKRSSRPQVRYWPVSDGIFGRRHGKSPPPRAIHVGASGVIPPPRLIHNPLAV